MIPQIKSLLLPLFILLLTSSILHSQTYFNQLSDATGYANELQAHQLDSLNAAAQRLTEALPNAELQGDFGVYDMGFYSHHTSYEGGIPDVMQEAIDGLSTSYYLFFGREIGEEGELKKVWVEMELPSTEDFCFWEDGTLSHLKFMVESRANAAVGTSASDIFPIFTATMNALDYMEKRLDQLVDCCGSSSREECGLCSWTTEEIREYFEHGGASFREIEINDSIPSFDPECVCVTDFDSPYAQQTGSDFLVENYTGISSFTLDSIQFQISELMDSLAWLGSIYAANGMSFYAVITDHSVFCGENQPVSFRSETISNLDNILENYNSYSTSLWLHVSSNSEQKYSLVNMTKGVGGNILIDCSPFPNSCAKFNWIFERFDQINSGFYFETIEGFCKSNSLDLIFKLADLGKWQQGSSSNLQSVLSGKISVNKISNNFFDSEEFCHDPINGYLGAAKTILHEMVHAKMKRLLFDLPSGTYIQRYQSLTHYNYALKFIRYKKWSNTISQVIFYVEHEILIKYFATRHMENLRAFNNDYSVHNNSYLAFITSFYFNPANSIENLQERLIFIGIETDNIPQDVYEYDEYIDNLIDELAINPLEICDF